MTDGHHELVGTLRLRELEQHEHDNHRLRMELARIRYALDQSVKLQSHYAELLNLHDGGARRPFADGAAWIARLDEINDRPPGEGGR